MGSDVAKGITVRHPVVILLSVNDSPFGLYDGTSTRLLRAAMLGPMVPHRLIPNAAQLLVINVLPDDPAFPHLAVWLSSKAIHPLDPLIFCDRRDDLAALFTSNCSLQTAAVLYEQSLQTILGELPPMPDLDPRVAALMKTIAADPFAPLAALASTCGMSVAGMSHLFSRSVGISMRSYRLWQKSAIAWCGMLQGKELTAVAHSAGFTDAAHFSREWRRWYGKTPSESRNPARVQVVFR
ncbi:helix-turn-helix domain-containing protein [Halopseudomonas sp.]|uniref:helix-turn-helix domain-containing protein n=1 Tax=Halopseudomonas sp. TaxID=2901191 RepID=UPI003001743F